MLILGIETTCDETAAAVVEEGHVVRSNIVSSQIGLHAKFGGVVPEVAARAHLESLDAIIDQALKSAGITRPADQLAGVAVAHCPGLIGCLLVGTAAAKALAFSWDLPLLAVNHVQAHLYSVVLTEPAEPEAVSGRTGESATGGTERTAALSADSPIRRFADSTFSPPPFPAIGLVMSGGHSSLYHVGSFHDLVRVGQTQDDAVGEAFDKVAAILQLGYPGGPLIDALAGEGDPFAIAFPRAHLEKDSLNFSFSGLKTAVLYHVNGRKGRERDATSLSPQQKADVAASFQRVAAEMLVEKIRRAAARFETRSILIGGGVSANTGIRAAVLKLGRELALPVYIPPMRYCTDNAAMIAGLGYQHRMTGRLADLNLETVATV